MIKHAWDDLVPGQSLGPVTSAFDGNHVENYAKVADPEGAVYDNNTPPPLGAMTLHAIKEVVELPQGTVHARDAVAFHSAPVDGTTRITLSVQDKYIRRGRRHLCLRYEAHTDQAHVLTAFRTFVWPGRTDHPDTAPSGAHDFGLFSQPEPGGDQPDTSLASALAQRRISVRQGLLDEFGLIVATDGPVHTDPAVAAELFGGTILQGSYLIECMSQMMSTLSTGQLWATHGRLAAKIVGNAIAGDDVVLKGTVEHLRADTEGLPVALCSFTAQSSSGTTVLVGAAEGPFTRPNNTTKGAS